MHEVRNLVPATHLLWRGALARVAFHLIGEYCDQSALTPVSRSYKLYAIPDRYTYPNYFFTSLSQLA